MNEMLCSSKPKPGCGKKYLYKEVREMGGWGGDNFFAFIF